MAQKNAASVLPDPVGARINVWSPALIASHPCSWAAVGPANDDENHSRAAGEKRSRTATPRAYAGAATTFPGQLT